MYQHTPSRLRGPVSRTRAWWKFPASGRKQSVPVVKEVRTEMVARIRQEIAEGRYDTPERWDAALERWFARMDQP